MIGERLKEERTKLGLTQPEFGELVGAKKRTVIDWEKGVSSPTALQLAVFSDSGVDVTYIITGVSTQPALPPSLAADEQLLLDTYRGLPIPQRREMLAMLLTGKPAKAPKTPKTKIIGGGIGTISSFNGDGNTMTIGGGVNHNVINQGKNTKKK